MTAVTGQSPAGPAGPSPVHGPYHEPNPLQARRPPVPWRVLGTGAGVLGGEGLIACSRPALSELLAAADVAVPVITGLVLVAAILRGSDETCERVFRLLRWIANRPEPPGPPPAGAAPAMTAGSGRGTSGPRAARART